MNKSKFLTDKSFIKFLTHQVKGVFSINFDCNHAKSDCFDFLILQDSSGCCECTKDFIEHSNHNEYIENLHQWFKQIETHQHNSEYFFHPINMIKCFQTIGNYLTQEQGFYFCSPWLDGMLSIINLNNIKITKVYVIFRILCEQEHLETLLWLCKCEGNNATLSPTQQKQIFEKVCKTGQFKVLKFLLSLEENNEFGKKINKEHCFIWAGEKGHFDLIKLLLDLKLDQQISDNVIGYVFLNACEYGYIQIVKLLLELEGDRKLNIHKSKTLITYEDGISIFVSYLNFNHNRSFEVACKNSQIDVVKFLLSLEGDQKINKKDIETVFFDLCEFGYIELIKLLLELKGERKIDFHYALMLAQRNNRIDIIDILKTPDDDDGIINVNCL